MAKIANARGRRDSGSGYTRVLGNDELGKLISRVQATVISNGTELEKIIIERSNRITNLDDFINDVVDGNKEDGVYLCPKKIYARSTYLIIGDDGKKIEPDILIFVVEHRRICKVVELKDGDSFDTKKAAGEKNHLEEFVLKFGSRIPFVAEYYICCFNQSNKNVIYEGFKRAFDMEHILTGRELCEILNINYDDILELRRNDATENLDYFIDSLLSIEEVRQKIEDKI